MKKLFLFLAAVAILFSFASCGNRSNNEPKSQKKVYSFSKQDTTEVLDLVSQFITKMEKNDIRSAVEMLSIVRDDSIIPMQPVQQRRQAMALNMVKGIKYDVNHLTFNSNRNNEVKLDITLFEKDLNNPKPNMTSFYFRPVKFEGKWYLTVKDNISDRANNNDFDKEGIEDDVSDTEKE